MRAPRRVRAVDEPLDRIAQRAGWVRSTLEARGPAEAMGSRFDINGSIWLSDLLDSGASGASPPEDFDSALDATLSFRDRLKSRIRSVRGQIRRRYADPFSGPKPLPGPTAVANALDAAGARPSCREKTASRAAHAVSASHVDRFSRSLNTARAELIFLRDDTTPELQRLGPAATEIERIDAALSRALLVKSRALIDHMIKKLEASFESAFVAAALALPDGAVDDPAVVAAVTGWFVEGDGWLRAHVRDFESLALAIYDRDAELLTHLVDAACEIASGEGNRPSSTENSSGAV